MGGSKTYNRDSFLRLKEEVAEMELSTMDAIEALELQLDGIYVDETMPKDTWSTRLDSIEIFTMEEAPPLEKSIRKISAVSA